MEINLLSVEHFSEIFHAETKLSIHVKICMKFLKNSTLVKNIIDLSFLFLSGLSNRMSFRSTVTSLLWPHTFILMEKFVLTVETSNKVHLSDRVN